MDGRGWKSMDICLEENCQDLRFVFGKYLDLGMEQVDGSQVRKENFSENCVPKENIIVVK